MPPLRLGCWPPEACRAQALPTKSGITHEANKRRRLGWGSPRSSPDYDALLADIQQRPE